MAVPMFFPEQLGLACAAGCCERRRPCLAPAAAWRALRGYTMRRHVQQHPLCLDVAV